jgi:hypothetical protein
MLVELTVLLYCLMLVRQGENLCDLCSFSPLVLYIDLVLVLDVEFYGHVELLKPSPFPFAC